MQDGLEILKCENDNKAYIDIYTRASVHGMAVCTYVLYSVQRSINSICASVSLFLSYYVHACSCGPGFAFEAIMIIIT